MVNAMVFDLPDEFSGAGIDSLPRWTADPIIVKGSVYLIDPTNPSNPWASGVPGEGSSVPNLVSLNELPSGLIAPPDMKFWSNGLTGSNGKVERSGKGGLHVIVSQTQQAVLDTSGQFYAGLAEGTPAISNNTSPLKNWLFSGGYEHSFYMSMWAKITRVHKTGSQATWLSYLASNTSPTGNYNVALSAMYTSDADHRPTASQTAEYFGHTKDVNPAGNKFNSVGSKIKRGSALVSADAQSAVPFVTGNAGIVNTYLTAKGASPSVVLYRTYLEDLTVSGRTFSQVQAIDQALYNKEVVNAGGRYYNDTFTNPTTIP